MARSEVDLGAKSHIAAGLYFWRRGSIGGREAPQHIMPMPIGRVGVWEAEAMGECCRSEDAFSRCVDSVSVSVPAPMKPMPPGVISIWLFIVLRVE